MSYTKNLVSQIYTFLEIEEGVQPSLAEADLAIDDEFRRVFTHYSSLEERATPVAPRPTTSQSSKKGLSGLKVLHSQPTSSSTANFDEYNFYLMQPNVDIKELDDLDVLAWWKKYKASHPILSRMARDILTVQVSTVASESAFSQGRQQIGDHRHSLSGFSLQVLVCIRDWIRSERRNQNLEAEEGEEEEIEDLIASGPDQMEDFEDISMTEYDVGEINEMVQNW